MTRLISSILFRCVECRRIGCALSDSGRCPECTDIALVADALRERRYESENDKKAIENYGRMVIDKCIELGGQLDPADAPRGWRPPNDRGQGRKRLPLEAVKRAHSVRLTDREWAKLRRLGAAWLRGAIDRATAKQKSAIPE